MLLNLNSKEIGQIEPAALSNFSKLKIMKMNENTNEELI